MEELKKTKQRTAILELLEQNGEPLSAEDIFEELKKTFPSLALSTVYRNMDRFVLCGVLLKETLNDGISRYSPAKRHGHYLICTECKKRIPLGECPLQELENKLEKSTGFEIDSHELTLYGKCPNCK